MKKICLNIYIIISVIVMLWATLSYAEIISKNTDKNPEYSENNIIINLVKGVSQND